MKKFLVTRVRVFPFPKARFVAGATGRVGDPDADGRACFRFTRGGACAAAAVLVQRGFTGVEVHDLLLVIEWNNYVDFQSRLSRVRREQQGVKNMALNGS